MNQIRLLVVEDDIFISEDICSTLEGMGYAVGGRAYHAEEALQLLKTEPFDLVLLDIDLGKGESGIAVARFIRQFLELPFVFLTAYANRSTLDEAKQVRPAGYIVKPFKPADLFATIEVALFNFTLDSQPPSWSHTWISKRLGIDFTQKEVDILKDIFEGKTNRLIGEKHFISINTVKTHIQHIYDKLQRHTRSEVIAYLRRELSR